MVMPLVENIEDFMHSARLFANGKKSTELWARFHKRIWIAKKSTHEQTV